MSANLVSLPTPDQTYSREQIELVKRTLAKGATDDELALFLGTAKRMGLDPFAQQIRAIRRKEWNADTKSYEHKLSIEPGIDGFRLIAARTGELEGRLGPLWCGPDGAWRDAWLSDSPPAAARVGVLRRGFREPLWAVALYREYVATKPDGKPNRMWADRPAGQLAKCAEALALRAAFPHELGGTYTSEEMAQAGDHADPVLGNYAVVVGGIPDEATIRALPSVAAAKELVTREEVSDRYREAVKVAEVEMFGEIWDDFWRHANLGHWVGVLLDARLAVQPQAIQPSDPGMAHTPRSQPGSDINASAEGPEGNDATQAGPEPPDAEAANPDPTTPGSGRRGRSQRDSGTGKLAPSAGPAEPPSDQAEQAAFEQGQADEDPGRWSR